MFILKIVNFLRWEIRKLKVVIKIFSNKNSLYREKILGKWESKDEGLIIDFDSNAIARISDSEKTEIKRWQLSYKEQIILIIKEQEISLSNKEKYTVIFISNNEMILEANGIKHKWLRKDKKKYEYRLGDMVKNEIFRNKEVGKQYHYDHFVDSIATQYMQRTDKDNQYDILIEIVKDRTIDKKFIPPKDMLLIHLRTGNVIDDTPFTAEEFLSREIKYNNGYNYVKPISYYQNKLSEIQKLKIRSIMLITGFYMNLESSEKSLEYLYRIGEYFRNKGFKVFQRIDFNADDDFVYMCNAKYFISSGGGFSLIIKNIIQKRNGVCL